MEPCFARLAPLAALCARIRRQAEVLKAQTPAPTPALDASCASLGSADTTACLADDASGPTAGPTAKRQRTATDGAP